MQLTLLAKMKFVLFILIAEMIFVGEVNFFPHKNCSALIGAAISRKCYELPQEGLPRCDVVRSERLLLSYHFLQIEVCFVIHKSFF